MKALLAFCLSILPLAAPGATLTVTGNWTYNVSAADLTSGAGTNLISPFDSITNVISIDISNTPLIGSYRVYAKYTNVSWPATATISVKRTSNGTFILPLSLISGGTSFTTLSTTDTEIFSGELDRSNITLQIRVTGFSVALAPSLYRANVVLSITP